MRMIGHSSRASHSQKSVCSPSCFPRHRPPSQACGPAEAAIAAAAPVEATRFHTARSRPAGSATAAQSGARAPHTPTKPPTTFLPSRDPLSMPRPVRQFTRDRAEHRILKPVASARPLNRKIMVPTCTAARKRAGYSPGARLDKPPAAFQQPLRQNSSALCVAPHEHPAGR